MVQKTLDISEIKGAKQNIADLKTYGDSDTFRLLCKASSTEQGWMKSTKVCNVFNGCIVQVTTQQRNPDKSYAVAEALTYVPDVNIDINSNPRVLIPIKKEIKGNKNDSDIKMQKIKSLQIKIDFIKDYLYYYRIIMENLILSDNYVIGGQNHNINDRHLCYQILYDIVNKLKNDLDNNYAEMHKIINQKDREEILK